MIFYYLKLEFYGNLITLYQASACSFFKIIVHHMTQEYVYV
jgi:hypothetical protein